MARGRGLFSRAYSYSGFPSIFNAEKLPSDCDSPKVLNQIAHIGGVWFITPWNCSIAFSMSSRVTWSKSPVVSIGPSASIVVVAAPKIPILSYSCHE